MNNKPSKEKIILFFIVLILVIASVLIGLLIYLNQANNSDDTIYNEELGENFGESYGTDENGTIDRQAYFDIITCMRKYLSALNIKSDAYYGYDELGEYSLIVDENVIKNNIYNILSQNYIKKNNITIDNLYDHINVLENSILFVPLEISLMQDETVKSFAVHGIIESLENYSVIDEIFTIVNIDMAHNVFSIEPIYGNYNNVNEIEIDQFDEIIQSNENNQYITASTTYEDISKDYINLYKRLALGYPEKMYDLLNEKYRKARFENVEGFKKYVEENREKIIGISLEKYQVNNKGTYTQYVCIDQNGNYYIFQETAPMQYTVILDTYTIDLPEFVEQYENSTDEQKVLWNIQKFFDAINQADYKYAYDKLDETFRVNNFKTQKEFENYVKTNFFAQNELTARNPQKQNDIYLYEITIQDKTGQNQNSITKTFVMQLKEGTDFVMSFSV